MIGASVSVGRNLKRGATVVFESTVYPGATEEVCIPLIEEHSGLKWKQDFFVGYSPERINPGDKAHTLTTIVKVVSGDSPRTLDLVAEMYGSIITAGVYKAASIKVAEAAKVIENTQRDINIALINELSLIFHRIGIDTHDVLEAAGTKWNFLPFRPGLVGGHCIGVDPYYLTHKAEMLGYHPQVILAGRRINDAMGKYIAEQTVKCMINAGQRVKGGDVIVLGLTFKENCPDLRNSKVIDVIHELQSYGLTVHVHDPVASPDEARPRVRRRARRMGRAAGGRRHRRRRFPSGAGRAADRSGARQAARRRRLRRREVHRRPAGDASARGRGLAAVTGLPDGIEAQLAARPRRWLVTGSAGFIGSHLVEALLRAGQDVVSLDNFATGHRSNLDDVRRQVGEAAWARHRFIEGDIGDERTCAAACDGVEVVLHEAALGSVPRSISEPLATHQTNATGFLNVLVAARDAGVKRFVYAASSSTYGDSPTSPKVEDRIGRPLSPYAVTKYLNELYADVFARCYGLPTIGLRYFNVFGARQDPQGAYAAVIPRWVRGDAGRRALRHQRRRRNLARLLLRRQRRAGQHARGARRGSRGAESGLQRRGRRPDVAERAPCGDRGRRCVRLDPSLRSRRRNSPTFGKATSVIRWPMSSKARRLLGYVPTHDLREGLAETVEWYARDASAAISNFGPLT